MPTRKETTDRINKQVFGSEEELLELSDYEFEQWCGRTAKGDITPLEQKLLSGSLALAERWVDGLQSLVDSTETQVEHAQAELDEAELKAIESDLDADWDAYHKLNEYQTAWKLKANSFKRKVLKTLRKAERNLAAVERASDLRVYRDAYNRLVAVIAYHRTRSIELYDPSEEDIHLWSEIQETEDALG
jgi:multidrug efflux pump subunit AcrA (membrane-fusion protein)